VSLLLVVELQLVAQLAVVKILLLVSYRRRQLVVDYNLL
jgi:hypothetical protein